MGAGLARLGNPSSFVRHEPSEGTEELSAECHIDGWSIVGATKSGAKGGCDALRERSTPCAGSSPLPVRRRGQMSDEGAACWTCGYCRVQVRWMSGHEHRGLPANWTENQEGPACLACRRSLAGEAAVNGTPDLSLRERTRLRASGVVEFEVNRDPTRSNAEIAHAVHTSVVAVKKARDRLGAAVPGA